MTKAPGPRQHRPADGRGAVQKVPRQIEPHWWESMEALPSQILRPLRDATRRSLTLAHRRCRRNHALERLATYRRDMREWMQSVEAVLVRHGAQSFDVRDYEKADKFAARLTAAERRALEKCQLVRTAIAYAEMALEWLDVELSHGD